MIDDVDGKKLDIGDRHPFGGAHAVSARTFTFAGGIEICERAVAVEQPVRVSFGGVPFGVMMVTPEDLADFAYGFSLTEGVIAVAEDVRDLALEATPDGLELRIALTGPRLQAHLARKRALAGRTSCGLCGIEDLAVLTRAAVRPMAAPPVPLRSIRRALEALDARQTLNAATRAVHGAAWSSLDGRLGPVREDVGRHNALDKLVGALIRSHASPADGFVVITSRASFEMVEKVATFGCRTLVAISAPTALAITRAQALDLTLLAIARHDAVTAFHGADRIVAG